MKQQQSRSCFDKIFKILHIEQVDDECAHEYEWVNVTSVVKHSESEKHCKNTRPFYHKYIKFVRLDSGVLHTTYALHIVTNSCTRTWKESWLGLNVSCDF